MSEEELVVGHGGAGDDCLGKVVKYGGNSAVAGALVGTAEGCFLDAIPGSNTPMLVRALGVIVSRAVLLGAVGGVFAAGACASAGVRDKDDHVNAAVGGAFAGSVFGLKYRSWPLGVGLAVGLGAAAALIKYRQGTYLPALPSPQPTSRRSTSTSSSNDGH